MADTGDSSLTYGLMAKALGVTVTTVKSYRRKFPEFWLAESQGKPIRFPARTLDLCRAVQRHFRRGLSVAETRTRLAGEFETFGEPGFPPASPGSPGNPASLGSPGNPGSPASPGSPAGLGNPAGQACPDFLSAHVGSSPGSAGSSRDSLARMEALMEGLFSLQNRTHSLMAELLARLDTLADRLVPGDPGAALSGASKGGARAAPPELSDAPGPPGAAPPPASPASPGARVAGGMAGPGDVHPPAALLDMPVVVRSGDGDYLGVTSRSGKPFTLGQFEAFLVRRAEGLGRAEARWMPDGQEWTLRLDTQGQAHDHHFLKAQTPRGNTVARFAALSVGGKAVSEAALQTFLRQVKETLDQ